MFVFAFICEAFYLSVFVFANKWDMQLFVVTVGAKFYLLQALCMALNTFRPRELEAMIVPPDHGPSPPGLQCLPGFQV